MLIEQSPLILPGNEISPFPFHSFIMATAIEAESPQGYTCMNLASVHKHE